MASVILVFAAGFGIVFVILTMMMLHELSKHGVKVNVLFIKLLLLKYIHQYKQITEEKTGKAGPLYYPCIISINIALALTITSLILYF